MAREHVMCHIIVCLLRSIIPVNDFHQYKCFHKTQFITKLWSISWSQEQAARVCGHHMEGSIYALGGAGAICPDDFSDKPCLMCYSAKANSHLPSCGARKTLKKLCLIEISLPWLFISCIFNSQRVYMTVQSSLIPGPHLFCVFFCYVKICNQCCIL